MSDAVGCRSRDLTVVLGAAAVLAIGARAARDGSLRGVESRVFSAVNRLDERGFAPAWVVMQLGSLGGAVATGAAVAAAGRPCLGRRMAVVGALTWVGSKAVKPFVGRGRPAIELELARVLGREQAGLGYPSGHAGVVMAMASAAAPHVPGVVRPMLRLAALGIGATRVYVGAHLPLDIVGGIALGIGTERAVRLLAQSDGRPPTRRQGSSETPRSACSSWRS
jgi:glycosyltransferase 2 family protein